MKEKIQETIQKIKCKVGKHIWFYYKLKEHDYRICYQCMTRHKRENKRWVRNEFNF